MAESTSSNRDNRRNSVAKQSPLQDPPPTQEKEINWSELPPELLHLVFKKLPDLPDLVRFRAVCHRWRSAAILSDPPPLLPWFVKAHWDFLNTNTPVFLSFYSIHSGWINIKVPSSLCQEVKGGNYRYILSFDWQESKLTLLNPLTKREIELPPLNLVWCDLVCFQPDPTGAGDFVAIYGALKGSLHRCVLACCRIGDSKWVTVEQSGSKPCCRTYYKGMFYVHDQETRVTQVIDPIIGKVVHSMPPQVYSATNPRHAALCLRFFVESCGDLLGISCVYGNGSNEDDPNKCCFEIHRLNELNGRHQWVRVNSIGDRFLFLCDSGGVSYNAKDFPGFQRNSIYFMGSMLQKENPLTASSYLVVFDIQGGTAQRLNCPDDVGTWFLPGLH